MRVWRLGAEGHPGHAVRRSGAWIGVRSVSHVPATLIHVTVCSLAPPTSAPSSTWPQEVGPSCPRELRPDPKEGRSGGRQVEKQPWPLAHVWEGPPSAGTGSQRGQEALDCRPSAQGSQEGLHLTLSLGLA